KNDVWNDTSHLARHGRRDRLDCVEQGAKHGRLVLHWAASRRHRADPRRGDEQQEHRTQLQLSLKRPGGSSLGQQLSGTQRAALILDELAEALLLLPAGIEIRWCHLCRRAGHSLSARENQAVSRLRRRMIEIGHAEIWERRLFGIMSQDGSIALGN